MEARRTEFADIGPNSTVFDFGGFRGDWAAKIHELYGAHVHVFEPHSGFCALIKQRFEGNPAITVHDFALGSTDGTLTLSDDGDASSSFRNSQRTVSGRVVSVARFFEDHNIPFIDLIKINIEGGEYDLLPALVEAGAMLRVGVIQVQFHLFSEDDLHRREKIREMLAKTHSCDWSYDFVWEQWSSRR